MTFTEAAVEVLRRAGRPLHYREIAETAVREELLSHVGQDPEVTMGQRLAAMARRGEDRKVVALDAEGSYALTEWGHASEVAVEPVSPPLCPPDTGEKPYRAREREPRPINAQARRRIEANHPGDESEAEDSRGRKGQRRFPPPAEVVFEWLAQRQSGAPLAELSASLQQRNLLSEGLVKDPSSLIAALLEDNRRRTEAGRKPAFIVDGQRISLVEFPPPSAVAELGAVPSGASGRPPTAAHLVAESRLAALRALRRRLLDLDTSGFEELCGQLLIKMGMRDVRVAKRSKEGPLYLARQRRGVSDLRVAVRLVRGGREIARADVQELRKDLAHYSAQMGLVLSPGEAGREARSDASAAGLAPVALYSGEALAEELAALRVGVLVQTVEVLDVDEAFFSRLGAGGDTRRREEKTEAPRVSEPEVSATREPREGRAAEPARPEPEPASDARATTPEASASPGRTPPAREGGAREGGAREAERRDGRGRGAARRDDRRPLLPSEQAWGQPAGTPKKGLELRPEHNPGTASPPAPAGLPDLPVPALAAPEAEGPSPESITQG